jgi:hypothetical protein
MLPVALAKQAEYALKGINKPIGIAEYILTRNLPSELAGKLPKPEDLGKQIMQEPGTVEE